VTVFLGSAPISTASAPASRSRRSVHGTRLQSARSRHGSGPGPSSFGVVAESWKDASPMGAPLVLVAFLVTVALLLAPERPEAQEAICKRHAGVEACRVW